MRLFLPMDSHYNSLSQNYITLCALMSKVTHPIWSSGKLLTISVDFSVDLLTAASLFSRIFTSHFTTVYMFVVLKDEDFTYIHYSGSTSNLNFVVTDSCQ